jgi:hypothetical protein
MNFYNQEVGPWPWMRTVPLFLSILFLLMAILTSDGHDGSPDGLLMARMSRCGAIRVAWCWLIPCRWNESSLTLWLGQFLLSHKDSQAFSLIIFWEIVRKLVGNLSITTWMEHKTWRMGTLTSGFFCVFCFKIYIWNFDNIVILYTINP